MQSGQEFVVQVSEGERFEFGKNWSNFLRRIDERAIAESMNAVRSALRAENLGGLTVLDIGSGSGLSSLVFRRLGASVTAFDFDPGSVACTQELKRREGSTDVEWTVSRGSILDDEFIKSLGQFDVVYSWGVLHHTGEMWRAIESAQRAVRLGGRFCIAIYNDQGVWSRCWLAVKKAYNRLPRGLKWLVVAPVFAQQWLPRFALDSLRGNPLKRWNAYGGNRGMSPWHDLVDWVGGLPFEVAKPEAIFQFLEDRGFRLIHLKTCAGKHGCNEFTFLKQKT